MVRDANGQYSVSYVDMHGRTVATALAGKPTSKMDTLVSNISRTITKKLLDSNNNIIKDRTIESSRGLLVTKAGNNRFVYSLSPDSISIKDNNNVSVCYDCLYDLVITITDECNNTSFPGNTPIVITRTNFNPALYDTLCNANVSFPTLDTTIYLKEGNYLVTKQLTINKRGMDYYRDSIFMRRNATKTLTQFVQEQKTLLQNQILCQPTCQSCTDSLGTWSSFRNKYLLQQGIPITDTANYRDQALAAYVALQEQCNALCQNVGINSDLRQKDVR
ncbi:MAG: hypothetical protein IPP79_05020 [Chitinophagaceae bacterium]|nr:hypothetical protein [Chitinophagaceae bacterium]